jgi:hypothetical protein
MQRLFWLTGISVFISGLAIGQIKKQLIVEDNTSCETIHLQLKANRGSHFLKPSHNPEILSVFSNQEPGSYAHQFRKEIKGNVCEVILALEDQASKGGFSQTISSKVFSYESTTSDKFWKMYLTDDKPYNLELSYGLGNANIDLSGLAVKNLKINTASADVLLGYQNGIENTVQMDTLLIKVDLGSVHTKNLSLAKTHYVYADVGFGNVTLDFSTQPIISNLIKGSVGAGNLVVLLPSSELTPVVVKIKDSWLCSIKMPANLKKTSSNTFANEAYLKDPSNALSFDLDVSMGNIIFKQVSHQ